MNAFPTIDHTESGFPFTAQPGLSIREYFACRAPNAIPGWFEHVQPAKTHGPKPEYSPERRFEPGSDEDRAERARVNAEYDAFAPAIEQWNVAHDAWHRRDSMSRLVQWRWAYADAMIEGREPTRSCILCGKPNSEAGDNHTACEFEANHGDDMRRAAAAG